MTKARTITINGVDFELQKEALLVPATSGAFPSMSDLYDCYRKPSLRKVRIWQSWIDWANELLKQGYGVAMEISSATCHFFSINGFLVDTNGAEWNIKITYAHARIWKVER